VIEASDTEQNTFITNAYLENSQMIETNPEVVRLLGLPREVTGESWLLVALLRG
jgi:hypothetical protein